MDSQPWRRYCQFSRIFWFRLDWPSGWLQIDLSICILNRRQSNLMETEETDISCTLVPGSGVHGDVSGHNGSHLAWGTFGGIQIDLKTSMVIYSDNQGALTLALAQNPIFHHTQNTSTLYHLGTHSSWSYPCQIHSHEGHNGRYAHESTPLPLTHSNHRDDGSLWTRDGRWRWRGVLGICLEFVSCVLMTCSDNGGASWDWTT